MAKLEEDAVRLERQRQRYQLHTSCVGDSARWRGFLSPRERQGKQVTTKCAALRFVRSDGLLLQPCNTYSLDVHAGKKHGCSVPTTV